MESIPPSKRNTQADIQLRTRQTTTTTNHQQETDGCIQIKHNPEHQPSRMPLQPMEEWVVFLIMGSVLPGYMFRYQYCLVGGLEAIVLGSIRWCVWSFRPSSPLRLPHLKCLLLLLLSKTSKTSSTPTKANTQACSYLDFNQFLIRRITRNKKNKPILTSGSKTGSQTDSSDGLAATVLPS